jgi:hypothetical protein
MRILKSLIVISGIVLSALALSVFAVNFSTPGPYRIESIKVVDLTPRARPDSVASLEVKKLAQDRLPLARPDPVVNVGVDYHIDAGNAYSTTTTSFLAQASRVPGQCTQFGFFPFGCQRLQAQQTPAWADLELDPTLPFSPWDWVTVTASTSATEDGSEIQDVRHFAYLPDPFEPRWIPFEPLAEDESTRISQNRLTIVAPGEGDPPRLASCTCDGSCPPLQAQLPFPRRDALATEVALAIDQRGSSDRNGDGQVDVVAVEIEDSSNNPIDTIEIVGGSIAAQFYLRGPGAGGAYAPISCFQFGTADRAQGFCDDSWCSITPNNIFGEPRCLADVDATCDGQGKAAFHLKARAGVDGIHLYRRQLIEVEGRTHCTNN